MKKKISRLISRSRWSTVMLSISSFLLIAFWNVHPVWTYKTDFSVRILHTNDHHARLEPVEADGESLGGIARRKTLIDKLRDESGIDNEPLLLDAGDIFQGTLYFNVFEGDADLEFYNALQYDAVAIGNHDFDRGQQVLADFIDNAQFPVLSANTEVSLSSPLAGHIKPWFITERSGRKIGIFGLTTQDTASISDAGAGVEFADPSEEARQAVAELKAQGINKIIALTHLGIDDEKKLAREVDDIDIVIGGHSHTRVGPIPRATEAYPIVEKSLSGQTVLVITDWEWGKYLGDLTVDFDKQGIIVAWRGEPHPVNSSIIENQGFQARLLTYSKKLERFRQQVVGQTSVYLNGDRIDVRSKETNLGNLVAEAILKQLASSGAQVAIVNGGGIRASISTGEITAGAMVEALPFDNNISQLDLTGDQLQAALEYAISAAKYAEGHFPQVAGLRFTWDPDKSSIISLKVADANGDFAPVKSNQVYRIATSSFLLNGGDGYEIFKAGTNKKTTKYLLRDTVISYISSNSPITIKEDQRISEIGKNGSD